MVCGAICLVSDSWVDAPCWDLRVTGSWESWNSRTLGVLLSISCSTCEKLSLGRPSWPGGTRLRCPCLSCPTFNYIWHLIDSSYWWHRIHHCRECLRLSYHDCGLFFSFPYLFGYKHLLCGSTLLYSYECGSSTTIVTLNSAILIGYRQHWAC